MPPQAAMPEEGKLCGATWGGRRDTPLALQHTGSAILAKTPPLPCFPTFTLAMHAESEALGDTTPPAPSPCSWKQTVTVTAIPEAARCNIAPQQLDIPRSSFWNHSDMHH